MVSQSEPLQSSPNHTRHCRVCGRTFSPVSRKGSGVGPCCRDLQKREALTKRLEVLASEWVGDGTDRPFASFAPFAHTVVQWKCAICSHQWATSITNRMAGTGCPACGGKVATPWNCLAQLRPDVAALWDYEKNGRSAPTEVTPGTSKEFYFWCKDRLHSYKRPVSLFARQLGCKFCTEVATADRNLRTLFPALAAEWHPTANGALTPDQFLPGSNERVTWLCRFGHSWKAQIGKRALRGDGCSKCWTKASLIQIRTFAELKTVFPDVAFEAVICGYEVDAWIPSLGLGIEVDGYYWHRNRQAADENKYKALAAAGYKLVRIRDKKLAPVLNDATVSFHHPVTKGVLDALLGIVLSLCSNLAEPTKNAVGLYLAAEVFVGDPDYREICSTRNFSTLGVSLADRFPGIAAEWNLVLNSPLTPFNVRAFSNETAWFTCDTCKLDYPARTSHRTYMGSGCPFCSRNKVVPEQSLGALHPALVKELHPTKNGALDPFTIAPQSNRELWWQCQDHGHTFLAPVDRRVGGMMKRGRYTVPRVCLRENSLRARSASRLSEASDSVTSSGT